MKMRSYSIFTLALITIALNCFAQNQEQTISGKITDKKGIPLFGASIILADEYPPKGTVTDANGFFKIEKVKPGRHTLLITYIGYDEVEMKELLVTPDFPVVLTIQLQESSTRLSEVVVAEKTVQRDEALNAMAVVSARSFSIDQAERYAASMRDPARLALSFPGVRGQGDIVNAIIVRGNAPKGVLWRIEGVEVPDPNHFSQEGYGGGAVSLISGNVIGASDFYSGAFPAEFGNATSAVFDVRLRKGATDKLRYFFHAGFLGMEAGMEGPINKNSQSSFVFNYRYSTLAVFEKMGLDVGNTISTYQDLNFKLNFPTRKRGTFSIFGVGGMSQLTTSEKRRNRTVEKAKIYDMGVVGLSHSYSLNENNLLKSVVAFSANREAIDRDDVFTGNLTLPSYRMGASNLYIRNMMQLDTRMSVRSSLRSGITISGMSFKLNDQYISSNKTEILDDAELAYKIQGNTQWKYHLTEQWTVLTGIHLLFFGINRQFSVEPRLGATYQINKKQSLQFAAGLHSRMESLATYVVRDPWTSTRPNGDLNFTKALHLVAGHEFFPLENLKLKTEIYFQYLYEVPVSTDESSDFSMLNYIDRYTLMKLVNNGRGKNYGIELSLEKSFSKNYYLLANTSLFQSKYIAADGVWRNTRFNANYVSSFTAGKDFPFGNTQRRWVFGLNSRLLWAGGERKYKTQFMEQYSDYFRIDTRLSIERQRSRANWQVAVDIQNVTNRINESSLEDIRPAGLLPVASFRVSFH